MYMYAPMQSPCQFDNDLVLRQLRYTGMMETIKIRKSGYSVRVDFKVPSHILTVPTACNFFFFCSL